MQRTKNAAWKHTVSLFTSILLLIVVILSGCSSSTPLSTDTPTPSTEAGNKTETKGVKEELVLAVGKTDTGVFDPKKGWGTHAQIRLTHSSLLRIDSDMNFVPDLASSYETSEDALTWTFSLRDNVKFSNGDPVTAEDVKFTYEMLQTDGVKFDLSFMESIKARDTFTIVITLKEPRSTFVSQLTEIGIVPKGLYDDNYSNNPIGSGPYKVAQYNDGQQIILEYNDYWYGTKPQFKKLTLLLLEEDAALAAAKAKEADIVYVPPTFADQSVEGMTLLKYESIDSRGISMPTLRSGEKGKINENDVNVGNNVTSDLAIRKALSIGLSRDSVIDIALNGYGQKKDMFYNNLLQGF